MITKEQYDAAYNKWAAVVDEYAKAKVLIKEISQRHDALFEEWHEMRDEFHRQAKSTQESGDEAARPEADGEQHQPRNA